MPLDEEVAQRLRQRRQADHLRRQQVRHAGARTRRRPSSTSSATATSFCVSAQQNRGKRPLLDRDRPATARRPTATAADPRDVTMKLAIVGRRNTGKSTFINCLAESERMIVSEVAGTTRDSVDVRFERDGKSFLAIDTAGVRRKSSVADDIEFYSMARAERSIRRADVVLLFFDAGQPISKVDKQLAEYILEQ